MEATSAGHCRIASLALRVWKTWTNVTGPDRFALRIPFSHSKEHKLTTKAKENFQSPEPWFRFPTDSCPLSELISGSSHSMCSFVRARARIFSKLHPFGCQMVSCTMFSFKWFPAPHQWFSIVIHVWKSVHWGALLLFRESDVLFLCPPSPPWPLPFTLLHSYMLLSKLNCLRYSHKVPSVWRFSVRVVSGYMFCWLFML